jgi:hypothetical protein
MGFFGFGDFWSFGDLIEVVFGSFLRVYGMICFGKGLVWVMMERL